MTQDSYGILPPLHTHLFSGSLAEGTLPPSPQTQLARHGGVVRAAEGAFFVLKKSRRAWTAPSTVLPRLYEGEGVDLISTV